MAPCPCGRLPLQNLAYTRQPGTHRAGTGASEHKKEEQPTKEQQPVATTGHAMLNLKCGVKNEED